MRHAEPALTKGEVIWLENDHSDSVLSFLRRTPAGEILSVVNMSNRSVKVRVTFPETTAWSYDTLNADGAKVESNDNGPTLQLEEFGYLVAKRK